MLTPLTDFAYANPLHARFTLQFFKELPANAGVYFMLDAQGHILYIGKAKCLRKRLTSYRNAKPGTVPDYTLELLESIHGIRWETCVSETQAFAREAELIRALCPPFNIAGTEPENYLFIGTRLDGRKLHVRLSNVEFGDGYNVFGCFRHRRKTKSGYTALLRLICAATTEKPRFCFPAKITRTSPPWLYALGFMPEWRKPLEAFLAGKSMRFLRLLTDLMIENENIPPFMYAALQTDLETAREFYGLGPRATYRLRIKHAVKKTIVTPQKMSALLRLDVMTGFALDGRDVKS